MNEVKTGFLQGLLGSDSISMFQELGWIGSKIAEAAIVAVVALVVAGRIRAMTDRFVRLNQGDPALAILVSRIGFFIIIALGILAILPIFGLNLTAVFAAVGVLGLAVSLAMQDLLKNVLAGLYLLIERPFRPGDVIKVRDYVGTVDTVDLRTTTLRADGELVYVPNAVLVAEILVNRGSSPAAVEKRKI